MSRPRIVSLVFALVTVGCGVVCRFAPLHLPGAVAKYGGSALYAILIYWLFATALPRARTLTVALVATLTVTAIEFFKLVHAPGLDAFRLTLAGKLVLGRFFSVADLVAYVLAIAVVALFDHNKSPVTPGGTWDEMRRTCSLIRK